MEAKTEIHFIRLAVMRSVCWTSSWSIATVVFVHLCSPGIPQEVGLNSVSFLWFTQAWMEFALTAIHVFCLFFSFEDCSRPQTLAVSEGRASYFWSMINVCHVWRRRLRMKLLSPHCPYSPLTALAFWKPFPSSPFTKVCFACLGRFLIVYLNSKGESMQVNSNRDCPVIFPQVLSNVFSSLSKNRVNITKQFIPRKLSFSPTITYGTLLKALLYFPLCGPRKEGRGRWRHEK